MKLFYIQMRIADKRSWKVWYFVRVSKFDLPDSPNHNRAGVWGKYQVWGRTLDGKNKDNLLSDWSCGEGLFPYNSIVNIKVA